MAKDAPPRIRARSLRDDEDFRRVRDLLIETHSITPPGFNWEVRRWDGWRYYHPSPQWNPKWETLVQLWEVDDGRLIGAAHPEGTGDVHLEIHPDYRHFVEEEMLIWAEENLAKPVEGAGRQLMAFAFEYDTLRRFQLEKRHFEKLEVGGTFYLMRFGLNAIPTPEIANGYTVRETRPGNTHDAQRIADLLNAAFKRDFHSAEEFLVFTEHARCFRHDLNLVAEAPDGSFACYTGLPYDEENRYGIFEPVCTHPDHLQKGLAKALMLEALRRLKALGAVTASTETGDAVAANRLYESIGFTEAYKLQIWRKTLPG